ncbi:MAG: hypothetical protein JWO31_904, partial [Phycisphaerales bacterium]|nr:hypothetical protein [Phycisphaerales bacterium]
MSTNFFTTSVRAAARRRPDAACPVTGRRVDAPAAPFAVLVGDALVDPAAAREAYPDLARIASLVPAGAVPSAAEATSIGVAARSPGSRMCSRTGRFFEPRSFDLVGVSATNTGEWLTIEAGEDLAPALSAALHRFYGTTPSVRP